MEKVALIFGVSGQDGSLLARYLLSDGWTVHGASRDAELNEFRNLSALGIRDRVILHSADPTDFRSVTQVMQRAAPREVYNLSGQSSVGLSFEQPAETFESIQVATLCILEAIRTLNLPCRFYNAASSECFGDTGPEGADEKTPFRPRSPYAVAKAASFWTVANYREAYGLFATSGILFNHESPLRPERFVTRKIVRAAKRIANGEMRGQLSLGNLDIKRDWGWAEEYIDAMCRIVRNDVPEDFVIATGKSFTLREFAAEAFAAFGLDWRNHVVPSDHLRRPSDIMVSVGRPDRARARLGWIAKLTMHDVVRQLVAAEQGIASGGTLPRAGLRAVF